MDTPVTIIIPIYNAYEDTKQCIESLVQWTDRKHPILMINDASTDPRINELLEEISTNVANVRFIQNSQNLGFVKTCNLAFGKSDSNQDVVLLNSDTIVTPHWLDKLIDAAYSKPEIATVTPLTNNGTICSIPNWLEYNDIPPEHTILSFANLVEQNSLKEYPAVPTAVGFCMYIKRSALQKVGYFDEIHFGHGYGEENDFCCRASALGYIHIIDDSTFVYHAGSKSFGDKKTNLIEKNLETLSKLHPTYLPNVHKFIAEKRIQPIIDNIEISLFLLKIKKLSPICFILHNSVEGFGNSHLGGTEYHCAALIEELKNTTPIYVLYFDTYKSTLSLTIFYQAEKKYFDFPINKSDISPYLSQSSVFSVLFTDIIRYFEPSIIHIHHLIGLPIKNVLSVLLREKVPYLISIHDYYLICPSFNLIDYNQKFCYEHKNEDYCQKCSQKKLNESPDFKSNWSQICQELLENAQMVITPSLSTERYINREYDNTKIDTKVIRHGIFKQNIVESYTQTKNILSEGANHIILPFQVGFVGSIDTKKGAKSIIQMIETVNSDNELKSKFEFHFFGRYSESDRLVFSNVTINDRYERQDLHKLLKNIDVVIFPTIWPETYCLAADEVLLCGIPIISTPLGAIAERINLFDVGWISKSSSSEDLLVTLLSAIDSYENYQQVKDNIQKYPFISYEEMASCYQHEYTNIVNNVSLDRDDNCDRETTYLTGKIIFNSSKNQQSRGTNLPAKDRDIFEEYKNDRTYFLLSLIKSTKLGQLAKKKLPTVWKFFKILILKRMTDKL